jgi:hypothetical protein
MKNLLLALFAIAPCLAHSESHPSVADLAWMTGTWVGPVGEQTLEENWTQPAAGTIACVVRFRGDGKTTIYELSVIEEVAGSLMFNVRQWQPGFVPLDPPGQTMALADIGERRVSFKSDGPGNFATLTYTRPVPDEFHIAVQTQDGGAFQLLLRPKP